MKLDGAGQNFVLHRETRLHRGEHRIGNLVEERVDVRLALAGHGQLVRHDNLRDGEFVFFSMVTQFLHRSVGIFRLALLRRRVAFPFVKPAAGRVILQLVNRLVASHELARHRVWMRELSLGRVVNDVGQREIERLVAELKRIRFVRLLFHCVEEQRIHRGRFLADESRQRGAFGAVALARGAQAAEQMHLEPGRLGELISR